jgi:starch-binding outer membrane protein, SusD/RagB family
MKKIKLIIATIIATGAMVSCSDMLETDSSRQVFDPALDEKTDSMFFTVGILHDMQMLADQYVLTGEMRGDLVTTTDATETALRELADFSATSSNKYDSAYVYYRVINNCNYYIANRDTSLVTGSKKVTIDEFAEAKAIRAWAYLQLAKNYGSVPFFTTPITSIADVNKDYPQKDITGICEALAPDLAEFSGADLPNYGEIACGNTNWGVAKTVQSIKCMIPVDVILGDLYLEANQYDKAAQYYSNYLKQYKLTSGGYYTLPTLYPDNTALPNDLSIRIYNSSWSSIFSNNSTIDLITYIPMAVNMLKGTTSKLPEYFGHDYYGTSNSYLQDRQIEPSNSYYSLCDAQSYYYNPSTGTTTDGSKVNSIAIGDMRRYAMLTSTTVDDSTYNFIDKYTYANIYLYRTCVVYLKLAEALNRMGYPDAAFAVLKDGLKEDLASDTTYITQETKTLMTTTLPFFNHSYASIFDDNYGIHHNGCNVTEGTFTPYQMDSIVGNKMKEIASTYGATVEYTKADTINAVEDLICDEYALECAFEGSRFGDLCRIARHKNAAGTYSSNFGGEWLAKKLAYKHPTVNLEDESKWYLPFK